MNKRATAVLLCVLFVFFLSGCKSVRVVGNFSDYEYYLTHLKQYEDGKETPEKPADEPEKAVPAIDGFTPLTDCGFEAAQNFGPKSTKTAVRKSGKNYLLDKAGRLTEIGEDLLKAEISEDRCVFRADGMMGLKALPDRVILPAEFDKIRWRGRTLLSVQKHKLRLYRDEEECGGMEFISDADLLNEDTVLIDGLLYDLQLQPRSFDGYRVMDVPRDGMTLISRQNKFGFLRETDGKIIAPVYDTAWSFVNGYALTEIDGERMLVNKNGEAVFKSRDLFPNNFYDGYFCMKGDDGFRIFGEDFTPIDTPYIDTIQMNRAYGRYLLDASNNLRFFNLLSGRYEGPSCQAITPCLCEGKYYFVVTDFDQNQALLDENLSVLVGGCDKISFSENVLLISTEQEHFFYKKVGERK